jgi:hypothetical protein
MEYEVNATDQGLVESHLTFPVVTRNRIYTNMYIETYSYTESVDYGMNCIEYIIFFRKYIPKNKLTFGKVKQDDPEKDDVYYFKEDENDWVAARIRLLDIFVDFGFTLSMYAYRSLMILGGNSVEENMAVIYNIGINNEIKGDDKYEEMFKINMGLPMESSLSGLSLKNKEELTQVL